MKSGMLIGGLFVALLVAIIVVVDLVRIPDMLEVGGRAEILVPPEAARLDVGDAVSATVAENAAQHVAATMSAVIASLKAAGISDADISSGDIRSGETPDDNNPSPSPKPPTFTAEQSIKVEVHDLVRVGALITAVSTAGANRWNVEYYVSDETEAAARAKAQDAALRNAIGAADSYAARGGFRRGRVLKLVENNPPFPGPDMINRDYEMVLERGVNAAAPAPGFVVPKPQPISIYAVLDVLFELK